MAAFVTPLLAFIMDEIKRIPNNWVKDAQTQLIEQGFTEQDQCTFVKTNTKMSTSIFVHFRTLRITFTLVIKTRTGMIQTEYNIDPTEFFVMVSHRWWLDDIKNRLSSDLSHYIIERVFDNKNDL